LKLAHGSGEKVENVKVYDVYQTDGWTMDNGRSQKLSSGELGTGYAYLQNLDW
jgi:hypothetical protein